jgi:hypothetical protein
LLDVDGLKVLGELVCHDLIGKTHGVCSVSGSAHVMTNFGW